MAERAERGGDWADYAIIILIVWLAWTLIANGLANALQTSRPEVALRLWGRHPGAGTAFAVEKLRAERPDLAIRVAREVIRSEPLFVAAQRTLGLAYDRQKRPDLADKPLDFAGARSWRDSPTHGWLMQRRLMRGHIHAALEEADALLRRLPPGNPRNRLMAVMVAAGNTPQAVDPLVERLARRPGWRTPFLQLLGRARDDRGGAHAVLAALARTSAPPSVAEYEPWISRLVSQKRYVEAMAEWRALSNRGGETWLRDGGFERAPDLTPFTWSLPDTVGAASTIDKAPDRPGEHALRVDWDGFSLPNLPRQLLVLPAGRYVFAGEGFAESTPGQGRLHWEIRCLADGRPVAAAPPVSATTWRPFRAVGEVPAEGCPAQGLFLAPEPGERRSDQVVWFDHLTVAPVKAEPSL